MSVDKLHKLVSSLNTSLFNNERLATPVLAIKLAQANAAYPEDQTIGAMHRIIGKMVDNENVFISKGELKALANKLYSRNTKFAELFQEELGLTSPIAEPKYFPRDESTAEVRYEVQDQVLASALDSVFNNAPLKMYSKKLASQALHSVASSLDAWNLTPTSLMVDEGNEKFLVIKANYETPKGMTSLFIPVETVKDQVLEASVFMGNVGPQELNHSAIKSYLTTQAGTKLKINGSQILSILTTAASENREISDAEIALTKLTASRQGESQFFDNSIVGQKVAEAGRKDIEFAKSDEFMSFEKQFTTPQGQAIWQFGEEKVKIAREHIIRELKSYGHKNPQVVIAKSDNNSIFYHVSLDVGRVGFTVPVKIASGKIMKPSIMLCNGAVKSFNQESINELYVKNTSDYRAAAGASTFSGLKPSEVLDNLRTALAETNYAKAEDALNVLAHSGDTKAYATGFSVYMSALANKNNEPVHKCAHAIHNKTSEHPICSQTGLPTHKVYQDKDGNCRPMYRRGMAETYEGAIFNNYKIFG
jgi:hypothetical protein